MIVDLHSHTTASDGLLDPVELLQRARERGVNVLAITDHDTVDAHHFLQQHPQYLGDDLQLITGIELSTTWGSTEIHIVGLNFPLDHPDLARIVEYQSNARRERSLHIANKLAKRLTDFSAEQIFEAVLDDMANTQQQSSHGFELPRERIQIGRPHFARWLIKEGYSHDMEGAFRKYLSTSKMGNLKSFWPAMSQGVAWIRALGGTAVLAHPARYDLTTSKLRAVIKDFKLAGGHALEVQGSNHQPSQIQQMARFCQEFELKGSQGSDFHNPAYPWIDIGRLPPSLPADIEPVWHGF